MTLSAAYWHWKTPPHSRLCSAAQKASEVLAVDDVDLADPLVTSKVVLADEARGTLAPLERTVIDSAPCGTAGAKRCASFASIQTRNDLEDCMRAPQQVPKQPRRHVPTYTKEAEHFLLWAVRVQGKPMSSLVVDDGQAGIHWLAGLSCKTRCGQAGCAVSCPTDPIDSNHCCLPSSKMF